MQYRALIFDLDGTLLDTLEDISSSANAVLKKAGYPSHPAEAYRHFVGSGIASLMQRALPNGEAARLGETGIRALVEAMRVDYAARNDRSTKPYAGIPELLAFVRQQGLAHAILSNKPHPATLSIVARIFADQPFTVVQGAVPEMPLKPDPTSALHVAERLGCAPHELLYLGDSDVDMLTAKAAGFFAAGAAWGFRGADELRASGADAVCASPADVQKLI